MGMFSHLERLASPPPKPKPAPTLQLVEQQEVETVIKDSIAAGDYEVVDIGLTTPQPEPAQPDEESEIEINPILLALLEESIDIFDALEPLEQFEMTAAIAAVNAKYKKTEEK